MKRLFLILLAALLYACNDSGNATKRDDLDNTDNDDTMNRVTDSLSSIDSLRGR